MRISRKEYVMKKIKKNIDRFMPYADFGVGSFCAFVLFG